MLAAKTYMYLPLFLAKEKGIFKSVFEAKRIKDDIEFRIVMAMMTLLTVCWILTGMHVNAN